MKTGPVSPVERFGYDLRRAQHAFRIALDNALRPFGLTAPQYAALSWMQFDPGISNAALARAVFVSAQSMQEMIAKLEERGLLKRTPDPDHGRILRTKLLPKGLKTLQMAEKHVRPFEEKINAALGQKEVQHLTSALATVADIIGSMESAASTEEQEEADTVV